jgi:hypothetical protein
MKNPKHTILQLIAPASPVFAVYNQADKGSPKKPEHLFYRTCPVLALVEDANGKREVIGLIVEIWGLAEPAATNFLGYACSEQQAVGEFVSK